MHLSGLSYVIGDKADIGGLEGMTPSLEASLRAMGLRSYCRTGADPFENARVVAGQALAAARLAPGDVDLLLYAVEPSVNPSNNWVNRYSADAKDIKWLVANAGLGRAFPIGLSFFNCTSFLAAMEIASLYLAAGRARRALVVMSACSTDAGMLPRLPGDNSVEGDGAAAFVVSQEKPATGPSFEVVRYRLRQIDLGGLLGPDQSLLYNKYVSEKSLAIKTSCDELLQEAGVEKAKVRRFVLQNITGPVMNLYRTLCGFSKEQMFLENLAEVGHLIGIDNLVNLRDIVDRGKVENGDLLYVLGTSGMQVGSALLRYGAG